MAQELDSQFDHAMAADSLRAQIRVFRERGQLSNVVGWKVALNSPVVQQHLGLPGPLIDYLTRDTLLASDEPLRLVRGRHYLVEAEVALTVGTDVSAGLPAAECAKSIEKIGLAIELLDFTPGLKPLSWILGNHTYHHAAILGQSISADSIPAPDDLSLTLRIGKHSELSIEHSLIVGEFPDVVAFTARLAGASGRGLLAGDVILCGSLNSMAPVVPGEAISIRLHPFGELRVSSVESAPRNRCIHITKSFPSESDSN